MGDQFSELLERIIALSQSNDFGPDKRSMLHAYIACLEQPYLCEAITRTISCPAKLRLALRSRLLRLLQTAGSSPDRSILSDLAERIAAVADKNQSLRPAVDALHSAIFEHLPLPVKQVILHRWIDRGSRGSVARWLKATRQDPDLFEPDTALSYWRRTNDPRAAKSLAYQTEPEKLKNIIPELIGTCEEGWIVSKAVLRAGCADEACWDAIRSKHPATYLYLCAQAGRNVTDGEAFELVCRCDRMDLDGGRGLAIWAVGQLKMISVLDRLHNTDDGH